MVERIEQAWLQQTLRTRIVKSYFPAQD